MKDIKSVLGGIFLLILIGTGIFSVLVEFIGEFMKFILWLFKLSLTDFGLSPFAEIGIKVLTFVLSYLFVGIVFNSLGFFNSNVMKFAYFVLSTLIGFALSALTMFLQEHIITISWIVLSVFIISIVFIVISRIKRTTVKE